MAALSDQGVQDSIADFISEARQCAQAGKGFAAMSTIFNVVLAVTETVELAKTKKRKSDRELFDAFVPELTNKTSWLATRSGTTPGDKHVSTILSEIRNGMAHALSFPTYKKGADEFGRVVLVDTIADTPEVLRERPNAQYVVSTTDFVNAVEGTVAKLSQTHPNAPFDPSKRGDRGPATGATLTATTTSASGTSK